MRRAVVVFLAGLVACGGGGAAAPDSGIQGLVLIGPTCPVEQEGMDCDEEPYAGQLRIIDRSTEKVVATARSGVDGRFRVALRPGSYRLEPVSPNSQGLPFGKPIDVEVRPNTYEQVTVSFDSGIR